MPGEGEQFDEYMTVHFQAKVSDSYDSPDELTVFGVVIGWARLRIPSASNSQGNLLFSTANLEWCSRRH